jgi:autotransporter adhesin
VSSATALGNSASATTASAVAVGQSATVLATGGAAFGANAVVQASATNSVAIGQGSVASAPNTVSVGAAGAERRVTNVAAGVNPTDAVNVSQLQSVAAGMTAGFQSQINGLQGQIVDNQHEARAGTALSLAAAGLRYDDRPGKASLAAALGHFKGETGLALGLGYNYGTQLRFNAAVTGAPNYGYYGVSAGAAWTLN